MILLGYFGSTAFNIGDFADGTGTFNGGNSGNWARLDDVDFFIFVGPLNVLRFAVVILEFFVPVWRLLNYVITHFLFVDFGFGNFVCLVTPVFFTQHDF